MPPTPSDVRCYDSSIREHPKPIIDTRLHADYWDQTHEVTFEVRAQRRRRITLDPDVYAQVKVLTHTRVVLPETLVNLWLRERLQERERA